MSEKTTKYPDWNAYLREWRRRDPDRQQRYRYASARSFCERYEREHPDVKAAYDAKRAAREEGVDSGN